jgi:hypothetical protein
LVRVSRAKNALQLAPTATLHEGFARKFEMIERFGVLLASQGAALEIKQFLDQLVDHIFDSAAVDAYLFGWSVLENDVNELGLDVSIAPIHASKAFHVFTHS